MQPRCVALVSRWVNRQLTIESFVANGHIYFKSPVFRLRTWIFSSRFARVSGFEFDVRQDPIEGSLAMLLCRHPYRRSLRATIELETSLEALQKETIICCVVV